MNVALLEIVPQPQYQGYFKPVFGEPLDSFGRRNVTRLQGSWMVADTEWEWNGRRSELDVEVKRFWTYEKFEDLSLLEYDAVFIGIYRRFGEVRD